uniref:Transcription factor CBF/NF-Y/archaeal histone domain-containing protein n=1 Tax=Panagrolaimus sp. PS1159 TaxID=55785 RepID=A0AC35GWV4_9BILA
MPSNLIEGIKEEGLKQFKKRNAKEIFVTSTSVFRNPFEFPRQQKTNETKVPEIAGFKTSQRLLNVNQMYQQSGGLINQDNYQQARPQNSGGSWSQITYLPKTSMDLTDDKKLSELSMNGHSSNDNNNAHPILEQERFMPIANISRIMKRVLPEHAKLSKESKECIQECITEFFLFITSEAAEKCNNEKRKTITGEDLLASMETLGFDNYLPPLRAYLKNDADESSIENHNLTSEHLHHPTYASPPSHLNENYQQQPQQQSYIIQEASAPEAINHQQQQQPQQKQEDIDDIINYLPPNFRRVTEIYVDTTTEQHYISATSPGGTTGLIPIQLQATSVDGPPQPISVQTFAQQQNRQTNGH